MSSRVVVCLFTVVALVALAGAPGFRPAPVLAASGTVTVDTPLHDSPDPAAPVIALLSEGTVVTIDGPPVDGFYPVMVGDLSGWMRGETVQVEKDTPESVAAENMEADPLVNHPDETVPVEAAGELEPSPDPALSTTVDPATDPAADSSAAPEEAPPVAEPTVVEEAVPVAEPVPAEELPPVNESAPMDEPAMDDAAAAPPSPDLASAGDAISVLTTPDGAASAPDSAANAAEDAAAPTIDPNVPTIPVAEASSVGPASVTADAPILAGPGPEYGLMATAAAGSTVEKTGHVIDGYVTVQYAEVTGWVALDHLGAPNAHVEEPPLAEPTLPIEAPPADAPPAEPPPTELAPTEARLAETPTPEIPTVEIPTADTAPADMTPIESAPVDMAPIEAAPVGAPPEEVAPVDTT